MLMGCQTAWRRLIRAPLPTAVAVVSLGLGIGANVTIFHGLHTVLLRPLPFKAPDRLVTISEYQSGNTDEPQAAAVPNLLTWQNQSPPMEEVAGLNPFLDFTITEPNRAARVEGQAVTWNLFRVLGVEPIMGRAFQPEDDVVGAAPVLLVSERFWRTHLESDPQVIGRRLSLDGEPYTIVGVMPATFRLVSAATTLWIPFRWSNAQKLSKTHYVYTIGRLAPAADVRSAQARLTNTLPGWGVAVQPLHDALVSKVGPRLWLLMGAVGLVFLIACSNVAGLSLGRAAERRTELAVRAALGASRRSLVQLYLWEAALITGLGMIVAVVVARWATPVLAQRLSAGSQQIADFSPSAGVVLFMLAAGFLSSAICGVLPAIGVSADPYALVREASTRTTGGSGARGVWRALVIVQLSIALTLCVGTALLVRTLLHLGTSSANFSAENIVTFQVVLPRQLYMKSIGPGPTGIPEVEMPPAVAQLFEGIHQAVARIPGVSRLTAAEWPPMLTPWADRRTFVPHGGAAVADLSNPPAAIYGVVYPDYFEVLGIPVERGRTFTSADTLTSAPVAIISRSLAEEYWPGQDPIGRSLTIQQYPDERPRTIVGVVGDVKHFGLASTATPQFYTPKMQQPARYLGRGAGARLHMTYLLATTRDADQLAREIRQAVASVDPLVPAYAIRAYREYVDESLGESETYAVLLGAMATLAIVLAAVGLYGVISYSVANRRRELAVRQALGADRGALLRMVLTDASRLGAIGLVAGVACSLLVTRLLMSAIHGVTHYDPVSYAAVVGMFIGITLLAALLPAIRATRIDPAGTMKSQG